jgi:demethylmenaquinone methyltransferase/2-methoxy-6-polyprenyl-1,4-benzoquinol methylase
MRSLRVEFGSAVAEAHGIRLAIGPFLSHRKSMLPHPPLAARYTSIEDKAAYIDQLFNAGAKHYDGVVDWGFLRSGSTYRRWALHRNGLRPGHKLLDVACGTGLVAVAAMKVLGSAENITCVDPSEGMVSVARTKLPARFVIGRAEQLPFPDNSFDFLTMGYALRHVATLEAAFREYHRVLKPGGKVLLLEVTKPPGRLGAFLFRLYFGKIYPALTQLFTRSREAREMMVYFWETMDACVPPATVLDALRVAGFGEVKRAGPLGLCSEYSAVKT